MVGREEKIIRSARWICLLLMLSSAVVLQAQSLERGKKELAARQMEYNKRVNIGLKGGFRSTNYMVTEFLVDGTKRIEDNQKNYKLGYYGAIFARFNFRRRFLQTEVSYNIDRAEVLLDKGSTSNSQQTMASVTSNIQSLGFPLMYGYYFVRNGPYTLSVFGGPKIIYNVHTHIDYSNFDQQNIQEKIYPLNASAVLGVSVSISRVFFDFRYEQEAFNISKQVTYTKQTVDGTTEPGEIRFHRRGSSLSFSFGILF